LKETLWVLGALLVVFFALVLVLSLLFTTSWWFYALIYLLLIALWYKPTLVFYHSMKAGHMLKRREFEAAAQLYEKIAHLKQKEGYGDYAQGLAFYYRRHFQQAKRSFERALERGIKTQKQAMEPLVNVALLTLELELKRWKHAQEMMDRFEKEMEGGKKVSPKILSLFYALKGEYLYKKGRLEEAASSFKQAYARFPELMGEEAYFYARTLYELGRKEEAVKLLKDLLAPKHEWKFFRLPLAEIHDRLHVWEESNSFVRKSDD
jgi:tetratricopeptide (TPR) repeat protein